MPRCFLMMCSGTIIDGYSAACQFPLSALHNQVNCAVKRGRLSRTWARSRRSSPRPRVSYASPGRSVLPRLGGLASPMLAPVLNTERGRGKFSHAPRD